ncbi:hypothetical protein CXF83_15045 [Shewanella sp. Choline-02u-19]|uniref:hypothetical protein n=1 Tax=unclassified Shewanella TaxID=196818 RepID=UPI000C33A7AE|nr:MULTISPECIES: hypothetical protein [unclassified Shewanella]PKH62189.1 hypothetical protein CXF84_01375 [Shewanella sp. Bg11-22]PKI27934.1 hypothetical protein CXF83_15045 [Shewanella sp. Choline-02u-19]
MPFDENNEPMMNMKRLRSELKMWGRYWAKQELGQGYASRSACDRLSEPFIPSGCGGTRDHIPPDHINRYDMKVYCLAHDCRRALRAQYICKGQWPLMGFDSEKTFLYWLRRAEIALTC